MIRVHREPLRCLGDPVVLALLEDPVVLVILQHHYVLVYRTGPGVPVVLVVPEVRANLVVLVLQQLQILPEILKENLVIYLHEFVIYQRMSTLFHFTITWFLVLLN